MPEVIQNKYLGTLVKLEKAPAHIFEIGRAWYFHSQGMKITWNEEVNYPGPEFIATYGDVEIEIECKEFQAHTGRRIPAKEFSRLGDEIHAHLRSMKLMGEVAIRLDGTLPTQYPAIKGIADDVAVFLSDGLRNGTSVMDSGNLSVALLPSDDIPIDFERYFLDFVNSKPNQANVGFVTDEKGDVFCNPFGFVLTSTAPDFCADSFYDILRTAASRQFSGARPGVLCAYIPNVSDVDLLRQNDIAVMARRLFADEARNHIVALIVSSTHRRELRNNGVFLEHKSLMIFNMNNRFPETASFLRTHF